MAKTAREHLATSKAIKKVVMEADFAGVKKGQTMLVATPKIVSDYIRRIPAGQTRNLTRLRRDLARRRGCDNSCPVSTAMFVKIAAAAALEDLADGTPVAKITPFWRVLGPNDKATGKLDVDPQWVAQQRQAEGIEEA